MTEDTISEEPEWHPPTTKLEEKEDIKKQIEYAKESFRLIQFRLRFLENKLEKINKELEYKKSNNPWA